MRHDNGGLLTEGPNKAIASCVHPSFCIAFNAVFSLRLISSSNHMCTPYVPLWYIIILRSQTFLGLAESKELMSTG